MKNAMLTIPVSSLMVSIALVFTGCTSGDLEAATTGGVSTSGSGITALAGGSGCSVSAISGGATITCSDGTTATITNGTAGSAGSSGAQGITGPTGDSASGVAQYRVRDRLNNIIGTRFIGIGSQILASWTVVDDVEGTIATYLANGIMPNSMLYYVDTLCATTPLARYEMQNGIIHNYGTLYRVSLTTILNPTIMRQKDPSTGNCVSATGGGHYSQAVVYTGNLPLSFQTPARLEQF